MSRGRAEKQSTTVRRRQIARAALRLLGRHGAGGLGVVAVAREVGLAPSALYRHYRGMDEVLDMVVDLLGRRLLENVEAVRRETPDALNRLRRLMGRHIVMISENPGIPALVFAPDGHGGRTRRGRMIYRAIRRYLAAVAGIIRDGQRAGAIRRDIPAGAAAMMFLGTVQPAAFLWHLSGRTRSLEARALATWRLVQAALAPRGGRPRRGK